MEHMKVLVDTHVVLWWLLNDSALSKKSIKILSDPENEILVSAASAWEVATKYRIGKLNEAKDVALHFQKYIRKAGFGVLPITCEHASAAGLLPGSHRDPFDRMLIAQSKIEDVPILSSDKVFRDYLNEVLW